MPRAPLHLRRDPYDWELPAPTRNSPTPLSSSPGERLTIPRQKYNDPRSLPERPSLEPQLQLAPREKVRERLQFAEPEKVGKVKLGLNLGSVADGEAVRIRDQRQQLIEQGKSNLGNSAFGQGFREQEAARKERNQLLDKQRPIFSENSIGLRKPKVVNNAFDPKLDKLRAAVAAAAKGQTSAATKMAELQNAYAPRNVPRNVSPLPSAATAVTPIKGRGLIGTAVDLIGGKLVEPVGNWLGSNAAEWYQTHGLLPTPRDGQLQTMWGDLGKTFPLGDLPQFAPAPNAPPGSPNTYQPTRYPNSQRQATPNGLELLQPDLADWIPYTDLNFDTEAWDINQPNTVPAHIIQQVQARYEKHRIYFPPPNNLLLVYWYSPNNFRGGTRELVWVSFSSAPQQLWYRPVPLCYAELQVRGGVWNEFVNPPRLDSYTGGDRSEVVAGETVAFQGLKPITVNPLDFDFTPPIVELMDNGENLTEDPIVWTKPGEDPIYMHPGDAPLRDRPVQTIPRRPDGKWSVPDYPVIPRYTPADGSDPEFPQDEDAPLDFDDPLTGQPELSPDAAPKTDWGTFEGWTPHFPRLKFPEPFRSRRKPPTEPNTRFTSGNDSGKEDEPCKPGDEKCMTCRFNTGFLPLINQFVVSNQATATEPDLQELKARLQRIEKTVGVDEFPSALPLLTGDGNVSVKNLAELALYNTKNLDAIAGQFPAEVQYINAEGEEKTVKLENIAHAIEELFAALLIIGEDADAGVNIAARVAVEAIQAKISARQTGEIGEAIIKFLGFATQGKQRTVKIGFTPSAAGANNKLENQEMRDFLKPSTQNFVGTECVETDELLPIVKRILQDAEIARAALFHPLKPNPANLNEQGVTGDYLRAMKKRRNGKPTAEEKAWDKFKDQLTKSGAEIDEKKGTDNASPT